MYVTIGDIIKVEGANTFIAKIPPDRKKEKIGSYVKISREDGSLVGIIKNLTNSIREDLIPYMDPAMRPKYAPFNEDFRNSYYIIYGLGTIRNGIVKYIIDSPPDVGDKVELLSNEEIKLFHTIDGKPSIAYFHSNSDALPQNVLNAMIDQVEAHCPECKAMLTLVRKYIRRNL